jgi:tetratricopeptide (TPR) repeat protein
VGQIDLSSFSIQLNAACSGEFMANALASRNGRSIRRHFPSWLLLAFVFALGGCNQEGGDHSTAPVRRSGAAVKTPSMEIERESFGPKTAVETLDRMDAVLRRRPDDITTRLFRGQTRVMVGDFEGAIEDFKLVLKVEPANAKAIAGLGDGAMGLGEYEHAIQRYREAELLAPSDLNIVQNRAMAEYARGNREAALAAFSEVLQRNPKDVYARLQRTNILLELGRTAEAEVDVSKVLEEDANHEYAWLCRIAIDFAKNDFKRALTHSRRLSELHPENLHALAQTGMALVRLGRFQEAQKSFAAAIEKSGEKSRVTALNPPLELKAEARTFAVGQVAAMLKDRPALGQLIKQGDSLWEWLVQRFAGVGSGGRPIEWNPTVPTAFGSLASTDPQRPSIQISPICKRTRRNGETATFDELCSCAVFELLNIAQSPEFASVWTQATAGTITREEYAARMIAIEGQTLAATRQFYVEVFLPWAEANDFTQSEPDAWYLFDWQPTDGARIAYLLGADVRRLHYLAEYDEQVVARLYADQKFTEALARIDNVLQQPHTAYEKEDLARFFHWKAVCLQHLGKVDAAIAAYDEALREQPLRVESHIGRAGAIAQKGDLRAAIAGAERACQLSNDSDVTALALLAGFHADAKEFDKAVTRQRQAIEHASSEERQMLEDALKHYLAEQTKNI